MSTPPKKTPRVPRRVSEIISRRKRSLQPHSRNFADTLDAGDRTRLMELTLFVELHPTNDCGVAASTSLSLRGDIVDVVPESDYESAVDCVVPLVRD